LIFSQSLGSHPGCHARLADPRPKLWCAPWEYRRSGGRPATCAYMQLMANDLGRSRWKKELLE
jgi:hypothetical protein